MDDLQIHEFLEEYFKASLSKGIDHPAIVEFFEFDKVSSELRTLSLRDMDLGYGAEDLTSIISVPEGLSQVYTAELVKKYHQRSKLFEVNLMPVKEERIAELEERALKYKQIQTKLRYKIKTKQNPNASKSVAKLKEEVKEARERLICIAIDDSAFTRESKTIVGIDTGVFEKEAEDYLDYTKLTVSSEIKDWIKEDSPHLVLLTMSKLNSNIKAISVKHWKDILVFHFVNEMKNRGLKLPNRLGEGFIVRLLIYLQTLIEDKDLQNYDIFKLLNIDRKMFHTVYSLDNDCLLNRVQVHLQDLDSDQKEGTFKLLMHVSHIYSDLQEQLHGEIFRG